MSTGEYRGYTLTEAAERYRETLIFNNTLLKEEYPKRYAFSTEMDIPKRRRFGASEGSIEKYKARRDAEYEKKFSAYCKKLDTQVEPSVARYIAGIRAAFGNP